jgi:serine/threonine-protein kinase
MASLLGEIKRRKVFQVAAVYAVVAWLLVQIVATVEEPLGLPAWFDTGVIVLLAVGFPIALILSWAFEVTPEGIRSAATDSQKDGTSATRTVTIGFAMQTLVLLAVGFLVADQYLFQSGFDPLSRRSLGTVASSPHVTRFDYFLPGSQSFQNTARSVIALSPDGRYVVHDTSDGLVLRAMDDLETRLIAGADPSTLSVVFSPDSQSVAYWTGQQVERIAISGGSPVFIAEANVISMNWESDDTILISQPDGIYRVPASGGSLELLIPAEAGERISSPQLLPNAEFVLFSVLTGSAVSWDQAQIAVQSLDSGERNVLFEGGSSVRYLQTGHIAFARGTELLGIVFDVDNLTLSGGPFPLLGAIRRAAGAVTGEASYSISSDGTLAYVPGFEAQELSVLAWVDRNGEERLIGAPPGYYTSPRISPDGTKVAVNVRDEESELWTWDLARERLTRLTFDPGQDRFPLWSPSGQRIAYSSQEAGGDALYWRAADGTGEATRLTDPGRQIFPTSFLPDATEVLVYGASTGGDDNDDIAVFRFETGETIPLLSTAYGERMPALSPDGRWLAYVSNEFVRDEIYVRPYPDLEGGRWQVSTNGGTEPLWSRNGEELFFRSGDTLLSVPVETEPSFQAGTPDVVLEGQRFVLFGGRSYDASQDGERFLIAKQAGDLSGSSRVIVVQNWFDEVRRRTPAQPR